MALGTNISATIFAGSLVAMLASAQPARYALTDLGPVGPPPGQPYFITSDGLVSGAVATSDGKLHAVLWYRGLRIDIGAPGLGGLNSQAFGVNDRGQAVGEGQTSIPNGEDFCGFSALGFPGSSTSCLPFIWQNGLMTKLPTLGGANGSANLLNNRGEVVGFAETDKPQPNCPVSQFEPVIWENSGIHSLPTFPGDPDGAAFGINDNGQVVGVSGSCAPFNGNSQLYLFESHALLWEKGIATDLGSFGGTGAFAGNHACAINNFGQVVGHSDATGDATTYAFLWTRESGMQNLKTLPGDFGSLALGINDRGEVVGSSFGLNFFFRAFLWQNGKMTDLNSLIPANSPLYLQLAESINSDGDIVGLGQTPSGEVHGFLAIPRDSESDRERVFSPASQTEAGAMAPSESAREMLLRRLGIRRR